MSSLSSAPFSEKDVQCVEQVVEQCAEQTV